MIRLPVRPPVRRGPPLAGLSAHASRRSALLGLILLAFAPPASADTVAHLVRELGGAPSFKVRVQAASLLARVRDPRVLPALTRALASDHEEVVRAFVASVLGPLEVPPDQEASLKQALERAARDPSARVRRAARRALQGLAAASRRAGANGKALASSTAVAPRPSAPGRIKILVGQFGDRSGRASPTLREHVRREVMQRLVTQRRVALADKLDPDVTFVVEGSIKRLQVATVRSDVEATCEVDLVLSRPSRGIMMVASGEASVQRMRAHFKPQQRSALEEEAVAYAVQSAHDNLAQFLERQ